MRVFRTLFTLPFAYSASAASVNLATPDNIKLLQWWQQMTNQGLAEKLDSNTDNGANAFSSGTVAIGLESTGSLGSFTKGAASAKNPFTVATGFFPKINASDAGGPIIGGASLWAVNTGNAAKERAAWELTQFLASKTSQVTWYTSTGYFPISKAALTDPADQQWVQSKPQFDHRADQRQQADRRLQRQARRLILNGTARSL